MNHVQNLHLYDVQNLHFIEMQNLPSGGLNAEFSRRAAGKILPLA